MALLELAARGDVHLDSSVASYLPTLTLPPPLDPRAISVRDLLSHRTGIVSPAVTFLTAYSGEFTDSSLFAVLSRASARPKTFAYSNVNYVLAGYVLRAASGLSWQAATDSLVLRPLALRHTSFSLEDRGPNVAVPYAYEADGPRRLEPKPDATMHAGGGMASSLNDLLAWAGVVADGGRRSGDRVYARRTVAQALAPQATVTGAFGGFRRWAYGLGWYLAEYEGHDIVQCLGGFPGYRAHVSFDPATKIGVVAMVNEGRASAFLTEYMAQTIYDVLFDVPDRQRRFEARLAEYREFVPRLRGDVAPTDLTRPGRLDDLAQARALVGSFVNPDYGTVSVTWRDAGPVLRLGATWSFLEQLEPLTYGADLLRGALEGPRRVTMFRGRGGVVDSLAINLGSPAVFTRR
jgi:CubicO group peptidase (beta-lactamase class C family)